MVLASKTVVEMAADVVEKVFNSQSTLDLLAKASFRKSEANPN
jgi:hypothetical protein